MRRGLFAVAFLLALTLRGFADSRNDHATVGNDITVPERQQGILPAWPVRFGSMGM